MPLLRQCHHFPLRRLGRNITAVADRRLVMADAPAIISSASAAAAAPMTTLSPCQTKIQSLGPIRRCWKSSSAFDVRGVIMTSEQTCQLRTNNFTLHLQHPTQSRRSSSSRHERVPIMSDYDTLEEAIEATHDQLDILSPHDIAAFWTVVPQFLQKRDRRPSNKHAQHHWGEQDHEQQINQKFDTIIDHTLEVIKSLDYGDLTQTTLGFAKTVKYIGGNGEGFPKGKIQKEKEFIFDELAAVSMPILQQLDVQCLSNLIYAYGLAEYIPKSKFEDGSTFFDALALEVIPNLKQLNSHDLSNMLWAYANAKASNPRLFEETAETVIALNLLQSFHPRDISNMMWAYATAKEQHPQLFKEVADHIVALHGLDEFKPEELSNLVWAYSTADELHPKLFRKVARHICPRNNLAEFAPQALSNIVWAYATTGESHPNLFKKVACQIVPGDNVSAFAPQGLSNLAWAYATANEPHPKLFKKVAKRIIALDNLQSFKPQQLSNIVWAYATSKESYPLLFQKVADAAITRQNEFTSQNIANLLWAYATNGKIDQHLFKSLAPTAAALVGKSNSQELASLAWAFAVADVAAPSLFDDIFINACLEKQDEFNIVNLSQLHQWNLWQEEMNSNVRLPQSLQKKCFEAFLPAVPRPSSAFHADVIKKLSSIVPQPEEEVLTKRGYCLDAQVEVNGNKIGIVIDDPSHFLAREATGSTILKHRQAANLEEIPVVFVSYLEWKPFGKGNLNKKQQYLRALLGLKREG